MPPIAALLSRLLASRLGSAAVKAASSLRGMGGLAKPVSKESVDVARTMAEAYGSRTEQQSPRKQPESGGLLGRTVRHVVNFAGGLMGKLSGEDVPQGPKAAPRQSPRAAAIRTSFGDILAGRTTLASATQQQKDRQDREQQEQSGTGSSGGGLARAALGLAMKHPVAAAGLLAGVFGSLAVGAKRLGEAQAEGLKHLRAYNGQIAAAYARMTRSDILRTRQQAAATAGSTSALVDAVAEMRDAWAPVENVVTNIKNTIGFAGAKLFKVLGNGVSTLVAIAEKVGIIAKAADQPKGGPWQSTLNDLAKQYRDRNAPPPKQPAQPAPPAGGKRR